MRRTAVSLLTTSLILAATAAGAAPANAAVPANELPTRAVVKDPAGDPVGNGAVSRVRADILRASYRTPSTEDGTITVRVTWAQLRRTGPFQRLDVFVDPRTSGKQRPSGFGGARAGVAVHTYAQGEQFADRVRPEVLDVQREYGVRGTTTITLSTEWLDADKVDVSVMSEAGRGFSASYDGVGSRMLRVGPRR